MFHHLTESLTREKEKVNTLNDHILKEKVITHKAAYFMQDHSSILGHVQRRKHSAVMMNFIYVSANIYLAEEDPSANRGHLTSN